MRQNPECKSLKLHSACATHPIKASHCAGGEPAFKPVARAQRPTFSQVQHIVPGKASASSGKGPGLQANWNSLKV